MSDARKGRPERHPDVRGVCPSCGWRTLFVGEGGWLTCSLIGCDNPSAPSEVLGATTHYQDAKRTGPDETYRCEPCMEASQLVGEIVVPGGTHTAVKCPWCSGPMEVVGR